MSKIPRASKRAFAEVDANVPSVPSTNISYMEYINDAKKRRVESEEKSTMATQLANEATKSKGTFVPKLNTARLGMNTANSRLNSSSGRLNSSKLNTSTTGRLNSSASSASKVANKSGATNTSRLNSSRLNTSGVTSRTALTRGATASAISRQKQEFAAVEQETASHLMAEINDLTQKLQQAQVNYDDMKMKYERAQAELSAAKSLQHSNSDLCRQIGDKQSEISRLQIEQERAKREIEDLNRDMRALRDRYNSLEDRANRLQKEREEDDARHRREKLDLEAKMDSQRRDHMIELDNVRNEHESTIRQIRDDFDKMTRNAKIEHDRVVAQLQNENRTLKIDLDFSESTCKSQKEKIESLELALKEKSEELLNMEHELVRGEEERRVLHNTIIELKGNIRVFCRIRPTLNKDSPSALSWQEQDNLVTLAQKDKKINFNFDKVFGAESNQEAVFKEISQLVQSALDGYKVSIFAYGQTGSGKTFTMEGNAKNPGVIPLSVKKIFHTIDIKRTMREFKQWSYSISVSYLEIYNETIRDLLATNANKDTKLEIKHENGVAVVTNLITENVTSCDEIFTLLKKAAKNRSVASTNCNERSSRSHSVFTLSIHGVNSETKQRTHGVLNLIDLAGSERLNNSGATGDRMKETKHINSSLSCLGDVIFALAQKAKHVPYRNSKLTYLLQPYLDGEGKCLMFVNVGPEEASAGETLCSLRFAAKVNGCDIGVAQRRIK
jgi:kinesin family protein C1